MLHRTAVVALLLVCAAVVHADALKVGQDAPKFKAGGNIVNPPEFDRELKDCEGGVILIYEWHIRDGTKSALPDIQKYWDKWQGLGLYVWTIHRLDFEKFPQVDIIARNAGYTFPICTGGFYDDANDFFGYKDGKSFRTTVVDKEGKVAYYGADDGWKSVLEAEMGKIVYPNLGKDEVADKLEMSAKNFAKREFGKALNDAEKRLGEELSDEEKSDAELIVKRAMWIADTRNERITKWREEKRYDLVKSTLELLESEFKGHKIADDAKAALKELKKDKEIKKELAAFELLDKLIDKEGRTDAENYMKCLNQFAKQQERMKAGEVAGKMASKIKSDLE